MSSLDPLNGLYAAYAVVVVLLALAGVAYWWSRDKSGSRYQTNAVIFVLAAVCMLIVAIFIGVTEQAIADYQQSPYASYPATPWPVILLAAALVLFAFVGVAHSIRRHELVALTAALVGATAAFTVFASAVYYSVHTNAWALTISIGWIATALAIFVFGLTVAYFKGRSDERHAFGPVPRS